MLSARIRSVMTARIPVISITKDIKYYISERVESGLWIQLKIVKEKTSYSINILSAGKKVESMINRSIDKEHGQMSDTTFGNNDLLWKIQGSKVPRI